MTLTSRKIQNFLNKHGMKTNFHMFVIRPGENPRDQYRGFRSNHTVDQMVRFFEMYGIVELQYLGNALYITLES